MKKNLIAILLAVMMCFAFAACTQPEENPEDGTKLPGTDIGGEKDPDGDPDDDPSNTDKGFTVTFECDDHVTVYVYETQDMSGAGVKTDTAYSRDSETGEPLGDGNGQVNFKLVFDDGYELSSIDIDNADGYNNLKGSADTDVENGYRITKITDNLTVTVTSQEEGAEEDYTQGYKVTFVCDEYVTVTVYKTQDLSSGGEVTFVAYSRESGTGALTKSGDGQVNFLLTFADGYELDEIVITEGYKNLKGDEDTGVVNAYRITKISAELTVTVKVKHAEA
ncbi:MAG: hypothetical protein J1F39_07300 [Clostridiales bacterium]|nr:hypothetical protein [Clostridiales bacterium]